MKAISFHTVCKKAAAVTLASLLLLVTALPLFSLNASAASPDQITYFGTAVPCGKDNGYKPNTASSWNPWTLLTIPGIVMGLIPNDDPHRGWSLGSFFVTGYSATATSNLNSYQKDMPVYLKNAGDKISFGFKLEQDIDRLGGNSKYKISNDRKVIQDCWVNDPYVSGDLGRGVLIIVHRDWQGNEKTVVYKNFLEGKRAGACTEVQLFEEGDYRVVLCYEIYEDDNWNWITDWADPNGNWFNYRIESYFSVRNGNSMVYPFELGTGSELTNRSYTENGFRVDLAASKYLALSVKKEILNQSGTDIIEDTRFNKAIADGTQFTDEGKYTVTVKNLYTNLTTEKVIYVGTNAVMRCNAVTGLPISTINERLSSGHLISYDGTLQAPRSITAASNASAPTIAAASTDEPSSDLLLWKTLAIVATSVIAIGAVVIFVKKIYG